jgi:hypothetical protein
MRYSFRACFAAIGCETCRDSTALHASLLMLWGAVSLRCFSWLCCMLELLEHVCSGLDGQ